MTMKMKVNYISLLIFKSHFLYTINAGIIFSQRDLMSGSLNKFGNHNNRLKKSLFVENKINANIPQNIIPSQDTSILNINKNRVNSYIQNNEVLQNEYGFRPSNINNYTPIPYYQNPTKEDYKNYQARPSQTQILRPVIKGLDYATRPVYYTGSLGINPNYGGIIKYNQNESVGKNYMQRPNYDSTPEYMPRPNYDSTPEYMRRPNYDSRPNNEPKPGGNDDTGDVSLFDVVENTHKPRKTGWRILDFARANFGSALAELIGCPLQTVITGLIKPYVSNFIYFATKGLLAREIETDAPDILS